MECRFRGCLLDGIEPFAIVLSPTHSADGLLCAVHHDALTKFFAETLLPPRSISKATAKAMAGELSKAFMDNPETNAVVISIDTKRNPL